ncbi:hypothetical protein BURK2_04080 [Burkholderiales bacterium]|nr:MAG: hypothetical protein F9K47_12950 [Burkholderiales bacterium]CAG1010657.1 hypothetical protein BURK2_04080 [Burkholderiales bacterium]
MSGFILVPDAVLPPRWGEALCFAPQARAQAIELGAWKGYSIALGAGAHGSPAVDSVSGTQVLLVGRIYPEGAAWRRAHALGSPRGCLSNWLLERWQNDPEHFPDLLNGPAIALVWEARSSTLHVYTDRMGIFPVYANDSGPLRLASHPDVLADVLASEGRPCELDMNSLAECLATGSGVPPYTYHRGIGQLEAASHYRFAGFGPRPAMSRRVSWTPAPPPETPPPISDLAEEFAAALREAASRRDPENIGSPGLLLSGGADSRALLFSVAEPAAIKTFTFCDQTNPEARTAASLAAIAGSEHHTLLREPEHYGRGAAQTVRVTAGMWSIKDAHFCGFLPELSRPDLGNLMTGCYTDYLYKGLAYNRQAQRFFGKNLPLDDLGHFDPEFYQPHFHLAPKWDSAVQERLLERFPDAMRQTYTRHPEELEDLRLRPLSREADAMGRLFLLRTIPWDPIMADFALLPFYRRFRPEQKLNARAFRQAVLRLLPEAARRIPNNNDGAPLGASESARKLRYIAQMSLRKLARLTGWQPARHLATAGSWPDFAYYVAHSAVLQELWSAPSPGLRDLFAELLGQNPWRRPLADWAHESSDFILRLITLRIWLEQRGV